MAIDVGRQGRTVGDSYADYANIDTISNAKVSLNAKTELEAKRLTASTPSGGDPKENGSVHGGNNSANSTTDHHNGRKLRRSISEVPDRLVPKKILETSTRALYSTIGNG